MAGVPCSHSHECHITDLTVKSHIPQFPNSYKSWMKNHQIFRLCVCVCVGVCVLSPTSFGLGGGQGLPFPNGSSWVTTHLIIAETSESGGKSREGNEANKAQRKGQIPELHMLRCGSAPLLHTIAHSEPRALLHPFRISSAPLYPRPGTFLLSLLSITNNYSILPGILLFPMKWKEQKEAKNVLSFA